MQRFRSLLSRGPTVARTHGHASPAGPIQQATGARHEGFDAVHSGWLGGGGGYENQNSVNTKTTHSNAHTHKCRRQCRTLVSWIDWHVLRVASEDNFSCTPTPELNMFTGMLRRKNDWLFCFSTAYAPSASTCQEPYMCVVAWLIE